MIKSPWIEKPKPQASKSWLTFIALSYSNNSKSFIKTWQEKKIIAKIINDNASKMGLS